RSGNDIRRCVRTKHCFLLLFRTERAHQGESLVVFRTQNAPTSVQSVPNFMWIRAHKRGRHRNRLVGHDEIKRKMMAIQLPTPRFVRRWFSKEGKPIVTQAKHRMARVGLAGEVEEDFV